MSGEQHFGSVLNVTTGQKSGDLLVPGFSLSIEIYLRLEIAISCGPGPVVLAYVVTLRYNKGEQKTLKPSNCLSAANGSDKSKAALNLPETRLSDLP